jgi:uncharacterized protein (TIGR03067 family)
VPGDVALSDLSVAIARALDYGGRVVKMASGWKNSASSRKDRVMSRILGICAFACLIGLSGRSAGDDVKDKKPEALLEGDWSVVSEEKGGDKQLLNAEDSAKLVLSFKGNKYTFKGDKASEEEGTFKVDTSKKPYTIDLDITSGETKGKKQLGIFEVDATSLTLCVEAAGSTARPGAMKTEDGSNVLLFVFKKK